MINARAFAGLTSTDFYTQFLKLNPMGIAWNTTEGNNYTTFQHALADSMANAHAYSYKLSEIESDPRITIELLPDWERNFGLPEPCIANPSTNIALRQNALVDKMTRTGSQSMAYFVDLASFFGYHISMSEYKPTVCEYQDGYPCTCDDFMYDEQWIFRVLVTAYINTTTIYADCYASTCEDPLEQILGGEGLECLLNTRKPAHVQFLYEYMSDTGYDSPEGFDVPPFG